ncbi:MAG: Sbal_3080 family lipoprotein [Rhodanobacter sp.]
MKKILQFAILAFTLSGCTTVSVKPVNPANYKIAKVCIKNNPKVIVPDFANILEEGFKRHGIEAETYSEIPASCKFSLTYTATQKWDGAMVLNDVHLALFKGTLLIGAIDRDAPSGIFGGGGFSLNKWGSARSKMDPLMDKFLGEFPQNH